MALKPKNPNETPLPAFNERYEEFATKINDEVEKRLDAFIKANPKSNDYQEYLVKRHPERAVRAVMLDKMFRHEAQMKQVTREAPQAKEWLEQQPVSMKEWIMEKLKTANPFYREKTELRLIKAAKNRVDFAPRTGMSL